MPAFTYDSAGRIKYVQTTPNQRGPVTFVSSNLSLTSAHYWLIVTATATLTLPDATTNPLQEYIIKNRGTGITITIATTSSQLIDDVLTLTNNIRNTSISLKSDGTGWLIL